jgi:hypothetical protein
MILLNFIIVGVGLLIVIGILLYLSKQDEKRGNLDVPTMFNSNQQEDEQL